MNSKGDCGCSEPQPRDQHGNGVKIFGANKILRPRYKIPTSLTESKLTELIDKVWAADATAFDIALDAGYPVYGKRMKDVLVSHLHTDHSHHLAHMKSKYSPSTATYLKIQ